MNHVNPAVHQSLKNIAPLVSAIQIYFPLWRSVLSTLHCFETVKMLQGYFLRITYADEKKCPLCITLRYEQDGVVHFEWGCQHPGLIPLQQYLTNTIHRLLYYNDMDKHVMLHVCLLGDLPGAPMSLMPESHCAECTAERGRM